MKLEIDKELYNRLYNIGMVTDIRDEESHWYTCTLRNLDGSIRLTVSGKIKKKVLNEIESYCVHHEQQLLVGTLCQ